MTELDKARQDAARAIQEAVMVQLARAIVLRLAVKLGGAAVEKYANLIGRDDAALVRRGFEIDCESRFPLVRN